MKVSTDGSTVAAETDEGDAELARAVGDGVKALAQLAQTLGVGSAGEPSEFDTCVSCDERKRVRTFPINRNGVPEALNLCADCQADLVADLVEQQRAQARASAQEGDTPGEGLSPDDLERPTAEEGTASQDPTADLPPEGDDA